MKKLLQTTTVLAIVLTFTGLSFAQSKIHTRAVTYTAQGVTMKGYLAYDESVKGKRPGVLIVPEWWGLNDYVRHRAQMLAELGYTALAVDMYGEGKIATNPDEAGKLSSGVMKNVDVAKARFMAAMEFLKEQPRVDPSRIAAIGYCFGGGVVLNMAAEGVDLRGVVSFHGTLKLVKAPQPGTLKAKVLVLTGGDDKFVPPEQVEAFSKEMRTAGANLQVISYPGALHSFTNPEATELGKKYSMPIAYNADADRKSWDEMKKFLEGVLG